MWPQAKTAAEAGLQLDEMSAEAHICLGLEKAFFEWRWRDAAQNPPAWINLADGEMSAFGTLVSGANADKLRVQHARRYGARRPRFFISRAR